MFAFMKKLTRRAASESAAALMLYVVVALTIGSFSLVATASVITGLKVAEATKDATLFEIAADMALNDALRMANNPKPGEVFLSHIGESRAVKGELTGDQPASWQWYLLPVAGTVDGTVYDVYATGYRGVINTETARTIVGRVSSVPTAGARWIDNTAYYRPTVTSVFAWGMFGSQGVNVGTGATVGSFDSFYGTAPRGAGVVGTNKNISISSGVNVDSILLAASNTGNFSTRCIGAACSALPLNALTYGVDLTGITEIVNEKCHGKPLRTATGSTLTIDTSTVNCFESINLKGNITIDYGTSRRPSTGRPVSIYVLGNMNIAAGSKLNVPASASESIYKSPTVTHFFVAGSEVNIGANGTTNGSTDVRALIASSRSQCIVGQDTTPSIFYGSIACGGALTIANNTTTLWDEQTQFMTVAPNESNLYIWDFKGYRNLT